MIGSTKVTGKMIINMVLAIRSFQLAPSTKETTSTAGLKELANITGQTDNFIKDNGSEDSSTAPECGREPRETATSGSGAWVRPTGMEYTFGLTATDTKASLKTV